MKNLWMVLLFFGGILVGSQQIDNRFSNEYDQLSTVAEPEQGPGTGNGAGDLEGDDVVAPIDSYILLLALVAVGMIFYFARNKAVSS